MQNSHSQNLLNVQIEISWIKLLVFHRPFSGLAFWWRVEDFKWAWSILRLKCPVWARTTLFKWYLNMIPYTCPLNQLVKTIGHVTGYPVDNKIVVNTRRSRSKVYQIFIIFCICTRPICRPKHFVQISIIWQLLGLHCDIVT